MAFSVNDQVFFRHIEEHSWLLGTVDSISSDNKQITCIADDPKRKLTGFKCEKLKPEIDVTQVMGDVDEDVDDLLSLTILHDATLLRTLYIRYMRDVVYTNIGAIVVALNPFTFDIPWYKDDKMINYLEEGPRIEKNVPHSWAQAHNTYNELLEMKSQQCILVSGESGAGKTEASKIVVKYFTACSDRVKKRLEEEGTLKAETDEEGSTSDKKIEVGKRLQQCSPILESFGNARTVRNDNSSRFGKFMKIQFSPDGILLGASITRYLLEKSRILMGAKGERVYHAFYLVCRGQFSKEFNLLPDKQYRSLNSGNQLNNSDFDTEADFNEVLGAMNDVGLDEDAIRSVWSVVAAIITIINAEFISDGGEGSKVKDASHLESINKAAGLFGVDGEELHQQFLKSETVVRGEVNVRLHSPGAASDARDALCKAIYDGLFFDLVTRCNDICDANTDDNYWVGLLDIFGFEDFEKNSFEQLCINLANETLQGHYNTFVFNKDLEECKAEGINTVDIVCPDNTPCLTMISDPKTGLFALLDDECSLGKGTDKAFNDAAYAKFKTHPDFVAFKVSKIPSFGVRHYAGDVTYDVSGFLDKNRDTLKDTLRMLLRESTNKLIGNLLPPPVPKTGRAQTVSGFFRQQIGELMAVINSSNPHWIRCIKPHPAKKPKMFHGRNTMLQLESSGVLGTVKIRKAGYPVRILFRMFIERFTIYLPWKDEAKLMKEAGKMSVKELREKAQMILKRKDIAAVCPQPKLCQIGKTKVFMKSEGLTPMEKMRRDEQIKRVTLIQSVGRAYRARKPLMNIRYKMCIELIVKEWRDYLERTRAIREARAKREAAFREAMSEGTAKITEEFTEKAQEEFDSCRETLLMEVYEQAILEGEEVHRKQIIDDEDEAWSLMSVRLGLELVMEGEEDRRKSILRTYSLYFNCFLAEFIEYQLFYILIKERDIRVELEKSILKNLQDVAGDPEIRMELLLGLEASKRKQIYREGLSLYEGWLQRHNSVKYSSFFESERETRFAIIDEESFERDVRKKFERQRVWFALIATYVADEAYDRDFLTKSQDRYRRELLEHHRLQLQISGGDYELRKRKSALMELEEKKREAILSSEKSSISVIMSAFHDGRKSLLIDDIEFDEAKFRSIIQQSFFATIAVFSPSQELYSLYLQCWMMLSGQNTNHYQEEEGVYYDDEDYYEEDEGVPM